MSQPIHPFDDPETIHLTVPQMRQYWACLLRNCIDKYAQEHPLYSLFSSVLSTLSKVTCTSDSSTSPSTTGGTFLFSYPQCRIVDKTAVGNEEYAAISAYPDFGLLRSTITQLSDGHTVQLEQIKLLVEVKRLYRGDEVNGWFWADRENACSKLERIVSSNFRQLLLQAYCTFEAYSDNEVHIMLIVGIYFTLFKFSRPDDFKPLLEKPDSQPKRQKFGTSDSSGRQPKWKAGKNIHDLQLAGLIPPECISVVCPITPVFVDAQDWNLQLSDAFRMALNSRLSEVEFQPCSLFDLRGARHTPSIEDHRIVEKEIAEWYTTTKSKSGARTPPPKVRPEGHYYESPIGIEESPETPGYKGRALGIGTRNSLPRAAKREVVLDFFTSAGRQGGDGESGIGESGVVGDAGGGLQEGFADESVTESVGGGRRQKGKRKAANM